MDRTLGWLFRFDPDGSFHRVLEGFFCPNGAPRLALVLQLHSCRRHELYGRQRDVVRGLAHHR
jgi:hypothetical protein